MKTQIALFVVFAILVSVFDVRADEGPAPVEYRLTVLSNQLGKRGLVEVDVEGKNVVLLAEGNIQSPAWSPDGSQVAYWNGPGAREQIWIMKPDGTDRRHLTDNPHRNINPAWSPDGKRIAFVSQLGKEVTDRRIFVMDADGTNLINVSADPAGESQSDWPAWSPDGATIMFYSGGDSGRLMLMAADGSGKRFLVDTRGSWGGGCAWSPEGTTLAFCMGRVPNHLFVATAQGSPIRQFTTSGLRNVFPAWSPDGRYIAYVRYETLSDKEPGFKGDVVLYDVIYETHRTLPVHVTELNDPARPAWRPVTQAIGP